MYTFFIGFSASGFLIQAWKYSLFGTGGLINNVNKKWLER